MLDKNANDRYQCYKELYESELRYVNSLQVLVTVFLKPLQRWVHGGCPPRAGTQRAVPATMGGTAAPSCPTRPVVVPPLSPSPTPSAIDEDRTILTKEDLEVLFSNATTVLAVNAELLRALEHNLFEEQDSGAAPGECSVSPTGESRPRLSRAISVAFGKIMPFFRTYTEVNERVHVRVLLFSSQLVCLRSLVVVHAVAVFLCVCGWSGLVWSLARSTATTTGPPARSSWTRWRTTPPSVTSFGCVLPAPCACLLAGHPW